MNDCIWEEVIGDGPLVAVAVHDGHVVRESILPLFAIDDAGRLREEDPFTSRWTTIAPTRLIGTRSRFEVDLNRPRESAVYRTPDDAWGLEVWHDMPANVVVLQSLSEYDAFYERLRAVLDRKVVEHGRFVLFDLHSYNHRRQGPDGPVADPQTNPQVNIGTGTMNRDLWAAVVDGFISDLRSFDFPGGPLDVRENVKFFGGNVPTWVHQNYPDTGCAIAIEFKKFFMDEWTGEPDQEQVEAIGSALSWTIQGVLSNLAGEAQPI